MTNLSTPQFTTVPAAIVARFIEAATNMRANPGSNIARIAEGTMFGILFACEGLGCSADEMDALRLIAVNTILADV